MKHKKLELKNLRVSSFVTMSPSEKDMARGGESYASNCDPTCEAWCYTDLCTQTCPSNCCGGGGGSHEPCYSDGDHDACDSLGEC